LINFDETLIRPPFGKQSEVTLTRRMYQEVGTRLPTMGSWIPFLSAEGELVFHVVVVKSLNSSKASVDKDTGVTYVNSAFVPQCGYEIRSRYTPNYYMFRPSGVVDGPCFEFVMKKFVEQWNSIHPNLECYLLGDNLDAHRRIETVTYMEENGVHAIFIGKNTSTFAASLDNNFFGTLKREINFKVKNEIQRAVWWQDFDSQCLMLNKTLPEAIERAMSGDIPKSSWRNTGQYPFNPQLMRNNALAVVGKGETVHDAQTTRVARA
jgi:hypothetical protein